MKVLLKLGNSFKYAIEGFLASFKTERNLKIHMMMMVLVILMGVYFQISRMEWFFCMICFAIVISAELFNTAIEEVVDLVMPHKHEKAKLAKDISASAVLVVAFFSLLIGIAIFLPKLVQVVL